MRASLDEREREDAECGGDERGGGDREQRVAADPPQLIHRPLGDPLLVDPPTARTRNGEMVDMRQPVLRDPPAADERHERVRRQRPQSGERE